jgi:hypothetical protein
MQVSAMEIRHNDGVRFPLFADVMGLRDAMSALCRVRWPTNTAKQAAREWTLTLDEAKGVVAGRTSQATLDKIFKHKNGGWRIAIPLMSAVIGHELDGFLANEQERLGRERLQHEARERELADMARTAGAVVRVWFGDRRQPDARTSGLDCEQGGVLGAPQDGAAVNDDAALSEARR